MQIKVCGLMIVEQIQKLDEFENLDWLGFIFSSVSNRKIEKIPFLPKNKKKVGVFVNENEDFILEKIKVNKLDFIQLHGDESVDFCLKFKDKIKVIKAFGLNEDFDFSILKKYENAVDFFLFDTQTKNYGGSGKQFDWQILDDYKLDKPFILSGGINPNSVDDLQKIHHKKLFGIDINSGFEDAIGDKNIKKIKKFSLQMKKVIDYKKPDTLGFYGEFGGAFVPELLRSNVEELEIYFKQIKKDSAFKKEFKSLMKNYVGRPSPLYFSEKLSKEYDCKIYLKREDVNHTGSHKINNAIGQILLARKMGKKEIIAETGAGQHGVATATVCALMNMKCIVFMGEEDIKRQAPNVERMKYLGATVVPAVSGSKTLKDATNEAIRYWISNTSSYYLIGSVVGPHPYPEMVAYFQSIISKEIKKQLKKVEESPFPTKVIACVGGGSNAAGSFYTFYNNENVELFAVEAAGLGVNSGKSAATSVLGTPGVLHGSYTLLMQDEYGQVTEPFSISAGLDYPGIGPLHAFTIQNGRTKNISITDEESLKAALKLSRLEGIIPALESAHAVAALDKIDFNSKDVVVLIISGRGDKDMSTYLKNF